MNAMAAAQQAWDNMLPPDTSRQEREHEEACKVAFDRYLESGDLPGQPDGASYVWKELGDDDASGLVLFDMLEAYHAGDDGKVLELAKQVAERASEIVNGMIEDAA